MTRNEVNQRFAQLMAELQGTLPDNRAAHCVFEKLTEARMWAAVATSQAPGIVHPKPHGPKEST